MEINWKAVVLAVLEEADSDLVKWYKGESGDDEDPEVIEEALQELIETAKAAARA